MLENLTNTFVRLGGAFEIVFGSNLFLHLFTLFKLSVSTRRKTWAAMPIQAMGVHESKEFMRSSLTRGFPYLFWSDGFLGCLMQLFNRLLIVA